MEKNLIQFENIPNGSVGEILQRAVSYLVGQKCQRHLKMIVALALSTLRARCRDSGSIRMERQRRKALKLLIVLIMTFFICWIPLYTYQTIGMFDKGFYRLLPSVVLDIILLLSFISTLCNPITYYFMSERYRTLIYERFHKPTKRQSIIKHI